MMLTIHGLSPMTRYKDLKLLIKQECSIDDFILDNLLDDTDGMKKVRVGLPDDNEGYKLMKCLDGYRTPGNYLLRVTPVGKPAANANMPMQDGFNPRPVYQPQRDDYPNQPRSDYNRGPQGPSGILRPNGPSGPGGGPGRQQGPVDNIRSPWSSNNNPSAQWGPNSSMTSQMPQNSFNFGPAQHNVSPGFTQQNPNRNQQPRPEFRQFDQGRQGPPSGPNYGVYPPESNIPRHQMDGRKNLRNIETVVTGHQAAAPMHGGRYPDNQQYPLEKPITILKDNFQGPTQYNISHPSGQPNYTQQSPSQWEPQTHQAQQSKIPMSKGGPYERQFEDRNYPQEQSRDPKIHQSRIDTSKDFDKRRGFSSSGRGDNVMQRRISPSRGKEGPGYRDVPGRVGEKRRISPGRLDDMNQRRRSPVRIGDDRSPQGRREDLHGRRYSPSENRISPLENRISPGVRRNIPGPRHESPTRRMSPTRRQMSPGRKDNERRPPRFSPNRHHGDTITDKYELESKNVKKVRPAYEPVQAHAQNQALYSGGYRPNIQENVRYSGAGMRQDQPAPWQRHREEPIIKKQEHDRMDERIPLARGRIIEKVENRYSPSRKSRSPNRRDRSPIRDRYKRNSRSPRSSRSPRRSWALEKRSSPEVPPPPVWPGQSENRPKSHRFPEKDDKSIRQPIWEGRSFKEEEFQSRRSNDLRQYDEAKIRIAKDLERNPPASNQENNFQKFPARSDYNERHDNYLGRNSPHQKMVKDDLPQRRREESGHEDYSRGRTSPYLETRKEINVKEFDKDFEDIYNRALQFKKKTEELKKTISKKSDEFEGNRRLNEDRESMQPRYDGRHRYHEAESQPLRGREERIEGKPRDDRAPRDGRPRDDRPRDDRPRDDRPRDDRPRDDRPRDDRPRDDRPRDDRPRDDRPRDDRPRDDRPRDDRPRDDRPRDDRPRDDRPRDDRPRDDMLRDDRPRDDRPRDDKLRDDRLRDDRHRDFMPRDDRFRDDKMQTERTKHFDDGRGGFQARDSQQECKKNTDDAKVKRIFFTDINVKNKRDRAVNEIAEKIIERNEEYKHVKGEQRKRILEELKLSVARIVYDMFGESDVSFIEVIIKFQAKYNLKDEEKLLQEVIRTLPQPVRAMKRHSNEPSNHPTKISRHPASTDLNPESHRRPKLSDSSFNVNLAPPSVVNVPCVGIPQAQTMVNQTMIPMMVSAPFYQTFDNLQQNLQTSVFMPEPVPPIADVQQLHETAGYVEGVQWMDIPEEDAQDKYRLYLCKDDFDKITNMDADLLKDFIISQMVKATGQFQGWAPDFTLKGLQTLYRYEVVTKDEGSKNWFLSLDFSELEYFDIVTYTKEELWYQRAAVWLPGHSRVRNIEPLEKLRLQNKKLTDVNIDKWKFIKKIVNTKGTRLYVDIPPLSARALEAHDMKLSYELQQVSVFLRAVAVDKNSFDAGLRESCITDPAKLIETIQNAPMPSLPNDPSLVKIVLRGSKTLDLTQARKIKEIVVYQLFKYHQQDGINRTDFLKYGFLQPNYFAIMPLNQESKQWLMGCSFGKVNRQAVVVLGGEEDNTKFIKMVASIPWDSNLREQYVIERLKHSNAGIKGINFSVWKPIRIKPVDRKRARFEVQVDMESIVTLSTMRYQLDYKDSNRMHALYFSSEYSQSGLLEMIKKYKTEMTDSYDVANMDLDSGQSDAESNDSVIFLE